MKKMLLILLAFCLPFLGTSQIAITKNQKLAKSFNKERQVAIEEGWDIVPFPGEAPQDVLKFNQIDPFATNWGVDLILPAAVKARLATECTKKVVVKIFDTSGKSSHSLLQQGQLPGSNFAGGGLEDVQGHGTHVAGIISADGFGVLDVLIDKGLVKWKPVKVLGDNGSGQFSWIATAIATEDADNRTLLQSGTFVVGTASLGGGTAKVPEVEAALKASTELGVFYTVATGNTGTPGVQYPGNSQYVVGIGSLDNSNPLVHSSYTSTGPELWEGMPGRSIQSTYLNNGLATLSGTSMATPFAASVTAIALSKWGNDFLKTPAQLKAYLAWCAVDLETTGYDTNTGWGIEFVVRILDKNPKDTPGGIVPPPPPPDPNPPAHTSRTLNFSLDGSWTIYWNNDLGLSLSGQPKEPETFKLKTYSVGALSLDALKITHLEIEIPNSTNLATVDYTNLIANTNKFFTNRGLQIAGGSDYADAGYWTAYFYEMILERQLTPAQSVNVTRIDFKDKNGKVGTWFAKDLKHWPIQ